MPRRVGLGQAGSMRALLALALAACSAAPAPRVERAPDPPMRAPAALPAEVRDCATLGARNAAGEECSFYSPSAKAFVEPDALTRRAYLYDRYADLYHSA